MNRKLHQKESLLTLVKRGSKGNRRQTPAGKPNRKLEDRAKTKIRLDRFKRGAFMLLRIVATVLVIVATLWCGFAGYRYATTSDYFAIAEIELHGNERLDFDAVLGVLPGLEGSNIFSVDGASLVEAIKRHPWIADARVKRRLPRFLSLTVVEHRPAAIVIFEVPYLVNDAGEIFKRWAPGDPMPRPIISGFERREMAESQLAVETAVVDAMSLSKRIRNAGLERFAPLAEIHRHTDGSFSIAFGKSGFYVKFGHPPYRRKIDRLKQLLGRLKRDGDAPEIIFLDNEVRPDRVTVRYKNKS